MTPFPFLSIEPYLTASPISAIDLYVLDFPEEAIGLPTIHLYQTSHASVTNPANVGTQTAQKIQFDLLKYNEPHNTIQRVTLRPQNMSRSNGVLLRWLFDSNLVRWFLVSELRLCSDDQDIDDRFVRIQFLYPIEPTIMLQPEADALQNGSLTLLCKVSAKASFEWQWTRDGEVLESNSKYSITNSDATRTTDLTIMGLNFKDSGLYSCEASYAFSTSTPPQNRSYYLHFPSKKMILMF